MKNVSQNLYLALSAWLTVSSASAAGLINSSFETPPVTLAQNFSVAPAGFGWTIASGNLDLYSTYWQASSGNQSIDLNGSVACSIYQDFTFSSSQTWAISFDLSANPDAGTRGDGLGTGIKNMRVDFGTPGQMTTLGTYGVDAAPRSINNMQWVTFTTPEVLVSDSVVYRLQFTSIVSGVGGPALDNVQLQVVPEPSAVALLCSGLIGFFVLGRSNKHKV